jgi:hypothetical protein
MITLHFSEASWRLWTERARALGRLPGLLAVLGRELRQRLRTHFLARDQTPNARGGARTHFWREVAHSVQSPRLENAQTVVVGIAHPAIRQKVFGGAITPKRARALTIPLSAEAHGRTADTLEHELGVQLFLVPRDFGSGWLAAALPDGRIRVHYLLRPAVTQEPDPVALPPREELAARLLERARLEVLRWTA